MNHRIVPVALVVIALVLGVPFGSTSAQDGGTKQVGLVVAFPEAEAHLEIVQVQQDATTFDVLQAARIELASENTAYGPAICGIDQVGCPSDNCFCDPTHFWAYYHLEAADGAWLAAVEGVGAYVPADRSVEGFAWSGFDADYNPTVQPPIYGFDEIVAATSPEPVTIPEPGTIVLLGAGLAGLAAYVLKARSRTT